MWTPNWNDGHNRKLSPLAGFDPFEKPTSVHVSGQGININPHLQRTVSNDEFGNSSISASACLKSIISRNPNTVALCFAIVSICGEISVARTWPARTWPAFFSLSLILLLEPDNPTNFLAAVTAGSPIPVAMSKTFWFALISASSTSLSLTFCAATSIVIWFIYVGEYFLTR